tara:strand:+ start:254 stop:430 length:177 start_codon:yes stop_codon:yes gene_type:complete
VTDKAKEKLRIIKYFVNLSLYINKVILEIALQDGVYVAISALEKKIYRLKKETGMNLS